MIAGDTSLPSSGCQLATRPQLYPKIRRINPENSEMHNTTLSRVLN
ncbi:MAG: hypothetical protein K6C95_10795 [Lachnospiraceae bacterium]|nr:hypothetical protein [Lachnospiraceae bacterium]